MARSLLGRFNFNKRIVSIVVIIVVVLLFVKSRGFRTMVSWKVKQYKYEKQLEEIKAENSRLKDEINLLKNEDNAYVESLIRRNLGYVKEGEIEFRFIGKVGSEKKKENNE